MIQMFNVTKTYANGVKALKDITLRIGRGEFVFMVGPSGAGKSTLTKLIFREEKPDRGHIMFNQQNICRLKNPKIPYLRRNIGMVFQDIRLLPDKTIFENVAFALRVQELPKKDIQKMVPRVLEQVGLKHKIEHYPNQLSGGEQQRVSIARAIVNNPKLIIADEPTGNLDPETSRGIMDLLLDINKCGTTILVVSHDRHTVDRLQKRVIALADGVIVRDEAKGGYDLEA